MFVNILSASGKYSILNRDNLREALQIKLSQKQKHFLDFISAFLKSILNFKHFQKKKMALIADVFPKLRTPKKVVKQISKKSNFSGPLTSNMLRGTKHY